MMEKLDAFISQFPELLAGYLYKAPWEITTDIKAILVDILKNGLDEVFEINDGVAIHKSAIVEQGVTLKPPVIVSAHCFLGAHSYFREGVFLAESVKVGPGCEIKSSVICAQTAIAHFNYVGNSIVGCRVNFEAGSIAANHYNERQEKEIRVIFNNKVIKTGVNKFGAIVGDDSKIGANAVLSPGTILAKGSVVKRLELVEQLRMES